VKMTKEHYTQMGAAFDAKLAALAMTKAQLVEAYADHPRWLAWDLLRSAGISPGHAHNDASWPVYDYLNDVHIETAVRHYFANSEG